MMEFPEWQGPYREALVETDLDQFRLKVSHALIAIANRLKTVELIPISPEEKQALDDALATLRIVQDGQKSDEGAA
jgi:hypothetical protein